MTNELSPGGVPPALTEQIARSENRLPARLFGEGFSEEMRKETTLTQYVRDLETWHPAQAAMLVCGLKPALDCTEIPSSGVMGLDNRLIQESWPRFSDARKVLAMWNSRPDAPTRVKPAEFVSWCVTKGIDTDWLREEVPIGEVQPTSDKRGKLTTGQRAEIAQRGQSENHQKLADEFKVSRQYVDKLVSANQQKQTSSWYPVASNKKR